MRKASAALAVLVSSLVSVAGFGTASAAQSGQGVTSKTITIGITYPDVAAIRNLINVDPGNYQVAYTALIDQINNLAGSTAARLSPSSPRWTRWARPGPPPPAPR